jgi:PKD repeat protein
MSLNIMILKKDILLPLTLAPALFILLSCNRFPEPDFSWEPQDNPEAGAVIWFANETPEASFYEWHFGDGIRSDLENPTHIFDEPGNYDVELSAYNDAGSRMKSRTITINDPTILAFTVTDSTGSVPLADAEIWIFDNEKDWEDFSDPLLIGYSNSEGKVEFANLESMVYYVYAVLNETDGFWITGGYTPVLILNEINSFLLPCKRYYFNDMKAYPQYSTPDTELRRIG